MATYVFAKHLSVVCNLSTSHAVALPLTDILRVSEIVKSLPKEAKISLKARLPSVTLSQSVASSWCRQPYRPYGSSAAWGLRRDLRRDLLQENGFLSGV